MYTHKRRNPKKRIPGRWVVSRAEEITDAGESETQSEIPTKADGEGHFDSRAFVRC